MPEEVQALFWREAAAGIADGLEELIEGSGTDALEVCLEFGECHFDGVEVWGASWERR